MRAIRIVTVTAVLLAGCGKPPPEAPPDAGALLDPSGSHELVFRAIQHEQEWFANPSPSKDRPLRLDLRRQGGSFEAVVTPHWGEPQRLRVSWTDTRIELAGPLIVRPADEGPITDTWTRLELTRAPNGRLGDAFTARGTSFFNGGDAFSQSAMEGAGLVRADGHVPEVMLVARSATGPENSLFPWDPLELRTSEPVSPEGLRERISLERPDGSALPVTWRTEALPGVAWAGTRRVTGELARWGDLDGGAVTWRVQAGLTDRAGLGSAMTQSTVNYANLGAARATWDFTAEDALPFTWGTPAVERIGLTSPDARCGDGPCVLMGPFHAGGCTAERLGLALTGPAGASRAWVRHRLVVSTPEWGSLTTSPLAIHALRRGSEPIVHRPLPVVESRLSPPVDDFTEISPWTNTLVTLPSGSGDETAIVLTTAEELSSCGGGRPLPPVRVGVLVMRIDWE